MIFTQLFRMCVSLEQTVRQHSIAADCRTALSWGAVSRFPFPLSAFYATLSHGAAAAAAGGCVSCMTGRRNVSQNEWTADVTRLDFSSTRNGTLQRRVKHVLLAEFSEWGRSIRFLHDVKGNRNVYKVPCLYIYRHTF